MQDRRPFATGSKPGPDAVDHFLETQGFYRKHVARDGSSLFRVLSEHIFDIQSYHGKVRQDCAEFMESHPLDYTNEVDKNLYNYISNLRKPRTHGSLLELRVMARKYCRNVHLFEPIQNFQTSCRIYVQHESYDENPPIRIYYSHKDKHFDVIYTMDYVEKLAECQAIVYDTLYTGVYRLPDVSYAVERMLHDQEEEVTVPLADDPTKYQKQSGDIVAFDNHVDTRCVLKDPKTCHFHNQVNFEEIVDEYRDSITVINRTNDPGRLKVFKPIDGFLHDKTRSCVRQLLDEKITPFPYKVAKALDSSIYRNTEFELWSEMRKEQKMKWLESVDFPMKAELDEKWLLYDRRKNSCNARKFSDGKFEQAMVDENEYMSMDDDMKKKYVVIDPSVEQFKFHHLNGMSNFMPSKDSVDMTVMPANVYYGNTRGNYKRRGGNRYNNNYRFNDFPNRNFGNSQNPMQTTSASELDARDQNESDHSPNFRHHHQHKSFEIENPSPAHQVSATTIPLQMSGPTGWTSAQPGAQYAPLPPQYAVPAFQTPINYHHVMPYGNFSIPPPLSYHAAPGVLQQVPVHGDLMNILRDVELSSNMVNWEAKESLDSKGNDLPLDDTATVQFFYNLGVRYYRTAGGEQKRDSIVSQMSNLEVRDSDVRSTEEIVEPPPVPTNTPVVSKSNKNLGLSEKNQQASNNFRRVFNVNHKGGPNAAVGGNQRIGNWAETQKEIKFNSNVKNLHKADTKAGNSPNPRQEDQKATPTITTQIASLSPILPLPQDVVPNSLFQGRQDGQQIEQVQHGGMQQASPQPQEFFPQQTQFWPRQYPMQITDDGTMQQQGIVYQVINEDGTLASQYSIPQYQYPQYPAYFAPQQQYAPQFAPQGPVMYPVQQPQVQQVVEGSTMSSNDSGVAEPGIVPFYPQNYQPQPFQYFAPSPQPLQTIYYAQPPLSISPQISQVGRVFPAPMPQAQLLSQAPLSAQSSGKSPDTTTEGRNNDSAV